MLKRGNSWRSLTAPTSAEEGDRSLKIGAVHWLRLCQKAGLEHDLGFPVTAFYFFRTASQVDILGNRSVFQIDG